jgi:hypothetical protein
MPLKLNVGLNKKIGEANYGSRGASVNVELELDSGLVTEPGKLQERIRQLFGVVRASLAEELKGHSNGQARSSDRPPVNQPQTNGNGTGQRSDNGQKTQPRPATQSQVRAIGAIAKRLQLDLDDLLRTRYQVRRTQDLSIKEASQLIDELKSQ